MNKDTREKSKGVFQKKVDKVIWCALACSVLNYLFTPLLTKWDQFNNINLILWN